MGFHADNTVLTKRTVNALILIKFVKLLTSDILMGKIRYDNIFTANMTSNSIDLSSLNILFYSIYIYTYKKYLFSNFFFFL